MKKLFLSIAALFFSYYGFGQAQLIADTEEKLQRMTTVENGLSTPLGPLEDLKGNTVDFSHFEGKLLVLDFWASWCGPCIQQTPYFEALAEKFKDEEVEFLKISIDDDRDFWAGYISKRNWTKNSYWLGTDEANPIYPFVYLEYDQKEFSGVVTAVPRYVILSKDGEILNNQAYHPSHPRLEKEIRKHLKRN
jgi:thiol-disulfide isomerase/thioredoxin